MSRIYAFPKCEKLCGKLRIKNLYDNGKRFTCWPLRITWMEIPTDSREGASLTEGNITVLLWAPKSLFRRANRRNRLRRVMREVWRLNSSSFKKHCYTNHISLQIAFNYIAKEELGYSDIERAMCKGLKKLTEYATTPA